MAEDTKKHSDRTILSTSKRLKIAHTQEWKCAMCHHLLPWSFVMDHIKPLRNGGTNSLSNFQALCSNCHAAKTAEENQRYAEYLEEKRTKVSRYFNPMCIRCLVDPSFDNRFLAFRTTSAKKETTK